MDEVDNIIVMTLKQIGCNIDDSINSLAKFSTDLVVEGCARCLKLIDESIDLPTRLPESMSVRFRIGTAIADACKKVGFEGDAGYQTFLYANVADLRRVFMFLLEKLPRDSGDAEDNSKTGALLQHQISTVIARHRSRAWTPQFCKQKGLAVFDDGSFAWEGNHGVNPHSAVYVAAPSGLGQLQGKRPDKDQRHYYQHQMPFITAQTRQRHQVAPSLLEHAAMEVTAAAEWEHEWNTMGLPMRISEQEYRQRKQQRLHRRLTDNIRCSVQEKGKSTLLKGSLEDLMSSFAPISSTLSKGTRFSHAKNLQFTKVDASASAAASIEAPVTETEEEIKKRREEELEALTIRLDELGEGVERMDSDIHRFNSNMGKIQEQTKVLQDANSTGKDEYKIKKRALELLSNVDENLAQLQGLVDAASQRLVALAEQWERHRQPLVQQHRSLKRSRSELSGDSKSMLEEIPILRQRIKEMMLDGREKEALHSQLMDEFEKLNKSISRGAYTRRILEIINSIKKQNNEIRKILSDTREIQKEINYLEGELERAFSVTDEVVFTDFKKHEINRSVYKLLASLHETFSGLLDAIRETANVVRENRDLEDQIEKEEKKNTAQSLQRIESDCNAMRQENRVLMTRYKISE